MSSTSQIGCHSRLAESSAGVGSLGCRLGCPRCCSCCSSLSNARVCMLAPSAVQVQEPTMSSPLIVEVEGQEIDACVKVEILEAFKAETEVQSGPVRAQAGW